MKVPKIQAMDRIEQWPRKQDGVLLDPKRKKKSKITTFVLDRLGHSHCCGKGTLCGRSINKKPRENMCSSGLFYLNFKSD